MAIPSMSKTQRILATIPKFISNRKLAKVTGNHVYNNNRTFIDGLSVASIVAKDGFGCYLYVTQSLNNKNIPDDKRKFVASLDLTNGLLMIGLQLGMFFLVNRKITPIFNKCLGKHFERPLKKAYYGLVKNKPGMADIGGKEFTQSFERIRGNVKDAFGGVISLVAASIVGKRILVPLIATPLAGRVEKKMNEMENKKKGIKPTDPHQPSMQGKAVQQPQQPQQTAQVAPATTTFDTGSTNLLERYKQQQHIK